MTSPSGSNDICMRCTGANITPGKVLSSRQDAGVRFKPDNMKFWSFSLTGGVAIQKTVHACLDCGFIWTESDPEALAKFVAKKCKPVRKR